MNASFDFGVTSMHRLPMRTTGQDFLHSCRHFLGLHLSLLTKAIRVSLPGISWWEFDGTIDWLFRSGIRANQYVDHWNDI